MRRLQAHRATLFILGVICCLSLVHCGDQTRFIFSTTRSEIARPDRAGLAYENVFFPSTEGIRLHGWLVPGDPGRPLVLFFHGNAANISNRMVQIRFLHSLGLSVFIFDYRGFGTSEGEALHENDLYEDADAALAWLEARGWTPRQMIYYGQSLGAAVAIQTALDHPPAGVVLECAFTTFPAIAMKKAPIAYGLVGRWVIDARFDNLSKIPKVREPVLIIHGTEDCIAPVSMGQALYARAMAPKALLLVEGAGHSNILRVAGIRYERAWARFLGELRARKARPAPNLGKAPGANRPSHSI